MDINSQPEQQNSCGLLNQTHSWRYNYVSGHSEPQCEQRVKTEKMFQVLFDSSLLGTMAPNKAPVKRCDSTRREAETLSQPAHCCVIRVAVTVRPPCLCLSVTRISKEDNAKNSLSVALWISTSL